MHCYYDYKYICTQIAHTDLDDASLRLIFSTIINHFLTNLRFEQAVKVFIYLLMAWSYLFFNQDCAEVVAVASIQVFLQIRCFKFDTEALICI
jgi:hypothetical protein